MTRPFRFGVQAKMATSQKQWNEQARKAEDLGYSVLTMPDHFDGQLAPTPALMAAASATTNLRVGALVYSNDYRHPVVFANEMATIDLLSDGRLELGMGAGWMTFDYEAAGIAHDRAGVRIERMIEAVEVIRGLFDEGPLSYEGEHYRVNELDLLPKPVQDHVPLLVGGGGPRMLRLAGRLADIVGVNLNLQSGVIDAGTVSDGTPDRYLEKISWISEGAADRFDDIELHIRTHLVLFTDDRQGTAETIGGGMGLSVDEALGSPAALVGDSSSMVDDVVARREEFGFSYTTVSADVMEQFAPVVAKLAGA